MTDHSTFELHFSTGSPQVDDILQGLIGVYEMTFPGKIKAYYLTGSYAYGDPVPTSDIDFTVIFKGNGMADPERIENHPLVRFITPPSDFQKVTRYLHLLSPIEIGFQFMTERFIREHFVVNMHTERAFLYGEDLLGELAASAPSAPPYRPRNNMHRAYEVLCRAYGMTDVLDLPLKYPAPEEEFYGYVKKVTDRYGRLAPGMEALKSCAYEPTTALIVLKTGAHIWGRKDQLAHAYCTHINDEYTAFVDDFFTLCRSTWHYLIPTQDQDRLRLRGICARALDYSKRFLNVYRAFVLAELENTDREGVLMAAKAMQKTLFKDLEIEAALKKHRRSDDQEVCTIIDQIFQESA